MSIIHQTKISLNMPVEKVRNNIMTPERILDYYPGGIEGNVIEAGKSFYCRGKSGVSLLELVEDQSSENHLVMKVTTALPLKPPYTSERIVNNRFFEMHEDWILSATGQGTELKKIWRDMKKYRLKLLPMSLIVHHSAKSESRHLKLAWEKML